MIAATTEKKMNDTQKITTGHGRGKNREEPRNNTVCFTVTKSEQASIDALSHCIHLRRSAILTEIVTRFMLAAQSSTRATANRTALLDFLEDCQEAIREKRPLFENLLGGR